VPRSPGETYAKLIQNCGELKISPAAGHSVIVEKPEETAKMVLDFFRTTLVAMTVHRPCS
jgi:pimeloyl-ACP methyl ester carboxylesterase